MGLLDSSFLSQGGLAQLTQTESSYWGLYRVLWGLYWDNGKQIRRCSTGVLNQEPDIFTRKPQ